MPPRWAPEVLVAYLAVSLNIQVSITRKTRRSVADVFGKIIVFLIVNYLGFPQTHSYDRFIIRSPHAAWPI